MERKMFCKTKMPRGIDNDDCILSPVTSETYPIRETIQTKCYHAYGHQVGWVIRYPVLLFLVPLGSRKKSSSST
jgi:hypothetical protein